MGTHELAMAIWEAIQPYALIGGAIGLIVLLFIALA